MAFKSGESGNPAGRPKGAIGKRLQLAKLLEPQSTELVEKVIKLPLDGDANALRLCIERLIPKVQRESTGIELPKTLNEKNIRDLKERRVKYSFVIL